ncbi:MAG: hypothetical protein AAFY06_08145 [Pseudomonadota bacterium]
MPRLLILALAAALPVAAPAKAIGINECPSLLSSVPFCAHTKKALESKEQFALTNGDVVQIDDTAYTVIDMKYGPILRRGDTIYVLPQHENSAYVRIENLIVRVDAETEDVLDLIRQTHLIVS